MSNRKRITGLLPSAILVSALLPGVLPHAPRAIAQAPATPETATVAGTALAAPAPRVLTPEEIAQRAKLEAEAEALLLQGEGRMKVASYEDAITEFRNITLRYPDTQARYKAQFRIADALVALKKEADALNTLQIIVKEESPDWSPRALVRIGDIYAGQQKYSDAFRSYRQVVADYPDNPVVDRAYYAIGATHFQLGHYELAAQELEKVGTAYASRVPEMQRVSPGEPLHVRLTEPNMVATPAMRIPVSLATSSGDREQTTLVPDAEGGDRFRASIKTQLGAPRAGDGILQLHGSDSVTLNYKNQYVLTGATDRTVTMTVAANARLLIKDSQGSEVRGVVISDTMSVELQDADRDTSDARDTVSVEIKTRKRDNETVKLTETGAHTGVFTALVKTAKGAPAEASGTIETDADFAESSATQYDDSITVTYMDEKHLSAKDVGPRKVSVSATMFAATEGSVAPVEAQVTRPDLAIKSLLYKGRSLSEIATTYRDLGQELKATINFRNAVEQFNEILTKYPNSPEVEDALYGLFQAYVGQDQYDAAIGVISQITRRFPQSARAPQALLELANLHVKREEYDRALGIFQSLLGRTRGTPLGEEANYGIVTTYMAMMKPRAGSMEKPSVTREQVTIALEEFARNFPNSDRTPEALFQLVRFRYDSEDFQGAVDDGRRMTALYPDNVMTGRVLLLQGQAQFKLRDVEGAAATFRNIVANYGGEADQASRLLAELQKRYGAGVGGGPAAPATETPKPATAPATTAPKAATPAPKAAPAAPKTTAPATAPKR